MSVLAVLLCGLVAGVCALDNGLGRTPQMGWNSWNHFRCNIDQDMIKETADALVSSKLARYSTRTMYTATLNTALNTVHTAYRNRPNNYRTILD